MELMQGKGIVPLDIRNIDQKVIKRQNGVDDLLLIQLYLQKTIYYGRYLQCTYRNW